MASLHNASVWRCALTGRIDREDCSVHLTRNWSVNDPQHQKAHSISMRGVPSPTYDWLWDILTVARLGDSGTSVVNPPPTYIVWFATTHDNKLIELLKT
jgi:hypothetical protein